MKHLRLVLLIMAASAWCAAAAFACDDDKGASATAANGKGSCSAHGTSAAAASANGGNCAMHGASAGAACEHGEHGTKAAAMAHGSACCMGTAGAMAASGRCDVKAMAHNADCAVCLDEATCDNDLRGMGVRSQVLTLRNGAMIVYSAESPVAVRSLQATVARYNDRIMSEYSNNGDAKLCGECKAFRGAMASGKFTRELVNVRNGCQILLTSSDKHIVEKIHDMANAPAVAARVKS
jgi:hypothetical protein